MSCKHIWWNLPIQIKEKLNITLISKWFKIPTEINNILRQLEQDKPTCYSQSFEPNYKVNWFTLLLDLDKVCDVVECSEVSLTAFNIGFINGTCCPEGLGFQPLTEVAYHNGINLLPEIGDICYLDAAGLTLLPRSLETRAHTVGIEPKWMTVDDNGVVTGFECLGCR